MYETFKQSSYHLAPSHVTRNILSHSTLLAFSVILSLCHALNLVISSLIPLCLVFVISRGQNNPWRELPTVSVYPPKEEDAKGEDDPQGDDDQTRPQDRHAFL